MRISDWSSDVCSSDLMLAEFGIAPDSGTETLQDFLASDSRFALAVAPLSNGFSAVAQDLTLLTENDLYPSQARPTRRGRRAQEAGSDVEAMVRDLPETSEERRVGKECVSTVRSRWSRWQEKKTKKINN